MKIPRFIVGIDVETTSLEPSQGEIIDVAAIRYDLNTGKEVGRYEQLCKPSKPITTEITALTGITNDMVADKPSFTEVREAAQAFIADDILFAHNATFDIKWLSYHGLDLAVNQVWDTFLLATVAWPESPSYNLGMLAADLQLKIDVEHRAAADVLLTWELLKVIRSKLAVPSRLYEQILEVLTRAQLTHYGPLFTESAQEVRREGNSEKEPSKDKDSLPISVTDVLDEGGVLAEALPGFIAREAQVTMAVAIERLIHDSASGLIEAGTGTGKTYAYLVPALQAIQDGIPVVISTHTRHLQDQLIEYDIPKLLEALSLNIKTAVLKGRRNYICRTRLEQALKKPTIKSTESFLLIKILIWLEENTQGDLERLNISHQSQYLMRQLHADALSCRLGCKSKPDCPYEQAKRQAAGAQLLVVNHALLVQGAVGEETGQQKRLIVIDEAHHLEASVRKAAELDLTAERFAEVIAPFLAVSSSAKDSKLHERIKEEGDALVAEYSAWLLGVGAAIQKITRKDRLLLRDAVRHSSAWQKIVAQASWRTRLKFIIGLGRSLQNNPVPARQQTLLHEALKGIERLGIECEQFIEGSSERIQWVELKKDFSIPGKFTVVLKDTALSVQPLLKEFFGNALSVILTSATLTTNGNFGYIKQRLGLESVEELKVPTPFDYKNNMLIYLVDDCPHPSDSAYEDYVGKAILDLTKAFRGRILALLTSQMAVKNLYYYLVKPLYKAKIRLLAQKVTGGRKNILEKFRKIDSSVLLGTSSFWEGIDIPGESLSCVVIPKVPFPPPDDPVVNAIAEHEGVNMFTDLFVPNMILRLRQGVGRLIRSSQDRGVVVILDPRLHQHAYGDEVLKSLPPATIHIGSKNELLTVVENWLGEDTLKKWKKVAADQK